MGKLERAAPPWNGRRSDGHDGDRRRPTAANHESDELGGEEEDGDVQEDRELTLSMVGRSVEAEVDGRRRDRGGGAADGGEEDETDAAM